MVRHARPQVQRKIPLTRALVLFVTLILVATGGGVVSAGLLLPVARAANQMVDVAQTAFDEMGGEIERHPLAQISTIHWPDGELMATFFVQNRIVVPLDQISQYMIDAVIAIEDERFFEHNGVDARAVARAAMVNLQGGSLQGASTLTMQYVKNRLIQNAYAEGDWDAVQEARRQDMARKAREAAMAIELEEYLTKYEILEGYLNIAQFGRNNIFGVEAAARFFFGVNASDLNLVQAATIAGITQAPGRLDPSINPEAAQRRRNLVLLRMRENDMITLEEYNEARAIPVADTLNITPLPRGCMPAGSAAFFCDYVVRTLQTNPVFGETAEERQELLDRGGIRVYTTLDREMQQIAQEEVDRHIPLEEETHDLEAVVVSLEPGTGRILAMAQNVPFDNRNEAPENTTAINFSAGHELGGSAGFQLGSVAKNMVLIEWLRAGNTLLEHVDSSRRNHFNEDFYAHCTHLAGGPAWNPRNAGNFGYGPTTVVRASYWSINTAFAHMARELDLCHVADTAWETGFRPTSQNVRGNMVVLNESTVNRSNIEILPAMFLGTQASSPLAVAAWHGTLASEGTFCEPIAITRVVGANGQNLDVPSANCDPRALEHRVATTTNYALTFTQTHGTARGTGRLAGNRPSAGKTGTNQFASQSWFVGYTPQLVTTVWVGSAEGEEQHHNMVVNGRFHRRLGGGAIAAPLWRDFMNRALEGEPHIPFSPPDPQLRGVFQPLEAVYDEYGNRHWVPVTEAPPQYGG